MIKNKTKICKSCKKELAISKFYNHKNTKDKLSKNCIVCSRKIVKYTNLRKSMTKKDKTLKQINRKIIYEKEKDKRKEYIENSIF